MSKFDRNWVLELETDKEKFCDAFFDVINKDSNKMIIENIGIGNSIDSDFFGTLRDETFTIWKRKGIFDLNSNGVILDRKMIADNKYLKLELRILNNFAFNYVRLFISAIPFTGIILFLFTRLISLFKPIPGNLFNLYLFITIPVLFVAVFYLQIKIIDKYLDRLCALYNSVLKKIEERAN